MSPRAAIRTSTGVVYLAYGYVFLEWLFFATKPSFLTAAPFSKQLAAFFIGALPFAGAALLVHGVALVAARALGPRGLVFSRLVPALICAATALILFDNFSYTVFGFSLARATWWRFLYLVGFAAIVWRLAFRREEAVGAGGKLGTRPRLAAASGLFAISLLVFAAVKLLSAGKSDPFAGIRKEGGSLPNIVFFAADGVNASRTSAYGYHRKTTPHLDARLADALVFDNAFTNSGRTTGSVTSMVTGKHPATTKVFFPPYILQGDDAYQTLPRLLRKLGYRTVQESVRYYADGPDLNWKESFHFANDRRIVGGLRAFEPDLQLASSFANVAASRLGERLLHMVGARKMTNPYDQVAGGRTAKVYGVSDDDRMRRVFAFIEGGEGPFFAHIHLMGTHCCGFRTKNPHFSAGEFATEEERKEAAYDDTIREADARFGALMDFLEARGLLENTLVVYSSDHTKGWDYREQVPLAFFFPDGAHRGRRSTPAQLLDVTPTVLDYLGIEPPPWLEGDSLLREDLPPERPIFAVASLHRQRFRSELRDHLTRVKNVGPPTYGLTEMGLVVCQRWYTWNFKKGEVEMGDISPYRDGCDPAALPSQEEARGMMEGHLRERGFSFPKADES